MTLLRRDRRPRVWRPGRDYRIICQCQRHARSRALWRRAVHVGSRALALLVGVPIALSVLEDPIRAMNLNLDSLRIRARVERPQPPAAPVPQQRAQSQFPIFTTEAMRLQFLSAAQAAPPTVDGVKENFFRTQVPYGAIIYREARRNGLPPELVAAVIEAESDFRPRLESHKKAQGLMQIIPDTSRLLGIVDPFDPEENIAAGTRYLRYLFDRFDDHRLALAAYNAGEGNVAKFRGVPPFGETQAYIERVGIRSRYYRQRVHNTWVASTRTAQAAQ